MDCVLICWWHFHLVKPYVIVLRLFFSVFFVPLLSSTRLCLFVRLFPRRRICLVKSCKIKFPNKTYANRVLGKNHHKFAGTRIMKLHLFNGRRRIDSDESVQIVSKMVEKKRGYDWKRKENWKAKTKTTHRTACTQSKQAKLKTKRNQS